MKVYLMYPDRDFDVGRKLPPHAEALTQDMELQTLFRAMADNDEQLYQVAAQAVLSGMQDDLETILYRQAVLRDCLRNPELIKQIRDIALAATDNKKRRWLGIFSRYPSGILSEAVDLLRMFMGILGELRKIVDQHAGDFESEGFNSLFTRIQTELTDDYFAQVKNYLRGLKFADGVLVSVQLGEGNKGTNYMLRKSTEPSQSWISRLFSRKPPAYTIRIDPRDEAGAQALSDLRTRGINLVANAMAQSADHIQSFFVMLQTELAFYLGCMNLHRQLAARAVPVCFPVPAPAGTGSHGCVGLRDVCLTLCSGQNVVGNDLSADGKQLVIITGANQGGKSTFLRGLGLAQLMMQCGMFVTAESFRADTCRGLFTHYKREEDTTMSSGKFDEELDRISRIVDMITPHSMVLFNESFAATNELEGSEIARQIVCALLESHVRIVFVTHLYAFANRFWEDKMDSILFLRAQRESDGVRPFKLRPGRPLQTSYGVDLYEQIFDAAISQHGETAPTQAHPVSPGESNGAAQ